MGEEQARAGAKHGVLGTVEVKKSDDADARSRAKGSHEGSGSQYM